MPKTKDAFAMRVWYKHIDLVDVGIEDEHFDTVRLHYIPSDNEAINRKIHFLEGFFFAVPEYATNDKDVEKCLVDIEIEKYRKKKADILYNLVDRHLARLNRFMTATALKFASGSNDESLKAMTLRGQCLILNYKKLLLIFELAGFMYGESVADTILYLKHKVKNGFSQRLKAARKKAGYTGTAIAEYLGITQKSYSQYETGRAEPPLPTIWLLAQKFHISVDWLLGLTDQ